MTPKTPRNTALKTYAETMASARRKYLLKLVATRSVPEAAKVAGINRAHLYKMLRDVGWVPPRKRTGNLGRWQEFGL